MDAITTMKPKYPPKYLITDRAKFPECIKPFTKIRGIAVGGCRWKSYDPLLDDSGKVPPIAHAHILPFFIPASDRNWICLFDEITLLDTQTLLHEAAHILTNEGHTKRWKEEFVRMGGCLDSTHILATGTYGHDYHDINELTLKEKLLDTCSMVALRLIDRMMDGQI